MCSKFRAMQYEGRGYTTLDLIRVPVAFLVPVLGEEFFPRTYLIKSDLRIPLFHKRNIRYRPQTALTQKLLTISTDVCTIGIKVRQVDGGFQ